MSLAGDGAVVLTQFGRLRRNGSYGPVINRIATLRVAGYSDPFERRSADDFADRFDNAPSAAQQQAFTDWLRPLLGRVDVVMVHEPAAVMWTLLPVTVQLPDAVNVTARPDDAVALTVKSGLP